MLVSTRLGFEYSNYYYDCYHHRYFFLDEAAPVLIEQLFFSRFPSFSFQEQEKQEKREAFPKVGNLMEPASFGSRFWARKIWKHKKLCEKKKLEIETKCPSIRPALYWQV